MSHRPGSVNYNFMCFIQNTVSISKYIASMPSNTSGVIMVLMSHSPSCKILFLSQKIIKVKLTQTTHKREKAIIKKAALYPILIV